MIEWVLGICVWILLVAAAYLFFKSKFEAVGELFGEDIEDGFDDDEFIENAEEYEEAACEEGLQFCWWAEEIPKRNRQIQNASEEEYAEDGNRENRESRKKEGHRTGIFGKLVISVVLMGAVYFLLPYYCVRREMTIDVGEKCPGVEAFLNWGNKKARYASLISEGTVLNRAGDYGVIIELYGRKMAAVLHVVGAAQPYIATKNVTIFSGESVSADDFVEEVEEIDDKEPPVIHGVGELMMTVGGSVSYKKNVTVTDNCDKDIVLDVDSSAVNVDKAGDYRVIYTAVDSAGNKRSVSTVLHVLPLTIETVTEEGIYAEADQILEKILTDSMSQYEQARAIYNWCHESIAYSDGTPKSDWVQGAYRGLVNRKGDCYVYAATAKCLLTRAGIKNMDIEKIPAKSKHYWNLIDIGDGWHHFDTCRRKDGSTFFYKTDAELMEYSDTHNKSHNYDRSLYTEIK